MKKENIDYAKDLVNKINGIEELIEDIKTSSRWGFKTKKKVSIFTQKVTKNTVILADDWRNWIDHPEVSKELRTYSIESPLLKEDIIEVLEKHKKLMEDALGEL